MGQEIDCSAIIAGTADRGKVQLETDFVLFRGASRVKIATTDIAGIDADESRLTLTTPSGVVAFELGARAKVWAEKLRNPKSVIDKLGIKPETTVALIDITDGEFATKLIEAGAVIVSLQQQWAMAFWQVENMADIENLPGIAACVADKSALWIVAPKGRSDLKDYDIINACRAAGLSDAKVVGFSSTHTAIKFIVPLARRAN